MKLKQSDFDKLHQTVLRFNAKLNEYPKQGVKLPNYRSTEQLAKRIEKWGYNEFRREIASMERFIAAPPEIYTTEQGVNITLWEKKEIDKAIQTTNRKRAAELKKYEPSPYKGNMGLIERQNLRPRKNAVEEVLPKNWDKYSAGVIKQAYEPKRIRQQKYKQNYLNAVISEFGRDSSLYKTVLKIPPSKMSDALYKNVFLQIGFVYDNENREVMERKIMDEWALFLHTDFPAGELGTGTAGELGTNVAGLLGG